MIGQLNVDTHRFLSGGANSVICQLDVDKQRQTAIF